MNAQEMVAKGMALLDQKGPANWRGRINLEKLDQASSYDCVLGQVFGNYSGGLAALFNASEDGFVPLDLRTEHAYTAGGGATFEELTDEWRKQLSETPAGKPEITLTQTEVALMRKRLKQMADPNHSLWDTTLEIQGVLVKLVIA